MKPEDKYFTKNGLLYSKEHPDNYLSVTAADRVAREYGFAYAEQIVSYLANLPT